MSPLTDDSLIEQKKLITVKFLAKGILRQKSTKRYSRQLPGNNTQWGNCRFTFDIDAKEYDWLVVYHDLPHDPMSSSTEKLCPREKTILDYSLRLRLHASIRSDNNQSGTLSHQTSKYSFYPAWSYLVLRSC